MWSRLTRPGRSPSTEVHLPDNVSAQSLRDFRSGVSIHAHTHFSRENLSFLPAYIDKLPGVRKMVGGVSERYHQRTGQPLDFGKAYWTPPLPPAAVVASETRQIEDRYGLQALVSLTDHDSFTAPLSLGPDAILSTEWTVHFEGTYVHLGVHNLDRSSADELIPVFAEITELPSNERALELLSHLQGASDTLVVLNHPLWDVEGTTDKAHSSMMNRFLAEFSQVIDAVEINGFRPWSENRKVLALGEDWGLPVVAGGDRHGAQPNTVLNLTSATTFAEFANEVRHARRSAVVLTPAYNEPLFTKQFGIAGDALGFYPDHTPDRQGWAGRVYFEETPGEPQSIATIMKGRQPAWLAGVTAIARSFGNGPIHHCLAAVLPREKLELTTARCGCGLDADKIKTERLAL